MPTDDVFRTAPGPAPDEFGLVVQVQWFAQLVRAGFPAVRDTDDGSFAVRTGQLSNTENGVVLRRAAVDPASPVPLDTLLGHATVGGLPASALLARPAPRAVTALLDRGWRAETGAHEMVGRLHVPTDPPPDGLAVHEVTDDAGLDDLVTVLAVGGWYDDDAESAQAASCARQVGFGPGRPVRHWVARDGAGGEPVAAATSFLVPGHRLVALTTCCVVATHRRRGIGTALTQARLVAARDDGATTVHVSPSPDGAALHRALGMTTRATPQDRWFYSPGPAARP